MTAADPTTRLLDRLAIVVGIFGSHGWPELQVCLDNGTTEHRPVTKDIADKVYYARKVLTEFGRKPITE